MSGGSLDYFCYKVDDVVDSLEYRKESDIHAVRELLIRLSPMMRAIEWHMSADTSRFDEIEAIEEFFGDEYKNVTLNALSDKIQELSNELEGMKK